MNQTVSGNNTKVAPCYMLIIELFNPQDETNIDVNVFMDDVTFRLFSAFLKELRDSKRRQCIILVVNMVVYPREIM